jgi:hypothetical protein
MLPFALEGPNVDRARDVVVDRPVMMRLKPKSHDLLENPHMSATPGTIALRQPQPMQL